jgi:protein-tyrosine phosphatase
LDGALKPWLAYVRDEKGIQRVLVLIDDNEMDHYDRDLLEAYENAGLQVHWEPLSKPGSHSRVMAILDDCAAKRERIVAHCTHGQGRSGRVAAGWLVHRYGKTDQEATLEVLESAREHGVSRMGTVTELNKWLVR